MDPDKIHNPGGGDDFFVYLPDRIAALNEWRNGRVPLWNPYLSGGVPFLGMQTANPLDPFILLELLLPRGLALGVAYALLLFVAGLGVVLYLRDQGLSHPGALALAGVAFSLNPYFLTWMENRVFLAGLATLPISLWAMERILRQVPSHRNTSVLALSIGYAALGGTLQTLALFLLVLLIRLVWLLFLPRRAPLSSNRLRGLRLAASLAGGLAIGLLPLVAGVEMLCHSTRLGSGGYYAASNFLHWRAVALWFNPQVFAFPAEGDFIAFADLHRRFMSGSGWGYAGILPLGLAVLALIRRSGPVSERAFWGGVSALTLCFLFLQATPIHKALVRALPWLDDVDLLRGLVVVNLSCAILAGWGAQDLARAWAAGGRRGWLPALGVYLAVGTVAVAVGRLGLSTTHGLLRDLLPLLLAGCGICAIGLISLPGRIHGLRAWMLASLTALELFRLHFVVNTFAHPQFDYPAHAGVDQMLKLLNTKEHPRYAVEGPLRIFPPNTGSIFGMPDVRGYSNIPIARYRLLLECAEGRRDLRNLPRIQNIHSPVYGLLGAGYLFAIEPFASPSFERIAKRLLHRRRDCLPRAFMVHDVATVPGESEMRRILSDPLFNPRERVYIEGKAGPPPPASPPKGPEVVQISSLEPTRVVIRVRATAPGILVLSDPFYPGWQAEIDGKKVRILPAYWGLRGVPVDERSQEVVFRYRPWWLVPAAVMTLAGLLFAIAGSLSWTRVRSIRKPERA
jgi:hypothetical protein